MRRLLSRLGFYLIALWASITLNFIIPRLMPGDPAQAYLAKMQGQHITQQTLTALRVQFGLSNDPIWIQYGQYLVNLLHWNLGISLSNFPQPVTEVIAQHIPWTVGLVGLSVIISFTFGSLLGMLVAWKRGSWLDSIVPPILTFISAIPYFWLALAFVYVLSFMWSWFPMGGGYDELTYDIGWSSGFIISVITHGILPAITIVLGSLSSWVLVMRNSMVTTLSDDYVLMAQAKGLPERRVMLNYAARNAILPSITSFSISLGLIVGGSLLTEMVFNYPGIGFALYNAVLNLDYSLIEGCFLVIAITVLAANLLSDIAYTFLDPRVRQGRG
ncbi:ABC transporter permease [Dictyobacter kobayashii]|uniref:Peptide ABC transporter permease n=1 Tax=Dictyobacter kobayashii TaxID=2014872 RepID=A0A402AY28_9CHLR|nr:ABC transporter permease [Dictyobacter kobayashii]GCE23988.1 peptide ABC transporter permease [Dictyobacter kobayashii]